MKRLQFNQQELDALNERKIIVLIDTSDMFQRSYHIPQQSTLLGENANAVLGYLNYYYNKLKADLVLENIQEVIHVLDPIESKSKYRLSLSPDYKANRTPDLELNKQKVLLRECLQVLQEKYIEVDATESDDIIGTLARYYNELGFYVSIYGRDKDLKQLVRDNYTCIYSFDKVTENEIVFNRHNQIEEKEVFEKYGVEPRQLADYLAICGDSSDNIKGLYRVGEKKARELLNQFGSILGIYQSVDDLPPKLAERFKEDKATLMLAKKLTTIQTQNSEILTEAIKLNYVHSFGLNKLIKTSNGFLYRGQVISKQEVIDILSNIEKYYHIEDCYSSEQDKLFYQQIEDQVLKEIFSQINPLNVLEHYAKIVPHYYLNMPKDRFEALKLELQQYV